MSNLVNVELDREPLKKTSLKTTPTMSLMAVVVAACTALKIDQTDSYGLRYNKTELDLSLSMRFANLPSGTIKLILYKTKIKSPKNDLLTIALQIEDVGRIQVKIPASLTLLELLVFAERSTTPPLNLTSFPEPPSITALFHSKKFMEPRCIYMNQEVSGFEKMSVTLLSDIGLTSGGASIRVSYVKSMLDEDVVKKMVVRCGDALEDKFEMQAFKKQTLFDPIVVLAEVVDAVVPSNVITETTDIDVKMDEDVKEEIKEELTWEKKIDLKIVQVIPIPVEELPESFYEISSNEAKSFLRGPPQVEMLKTKMIRDREAKEKMDKYPKTAIRLKFPDSIMLQMSFDSNEPVANLFESAEKLLLPEFPTYSLFVTPPHVNLVMEKTFAEQHLAPSSIVHIIFDTTHPGPFVHPEIMEGLSTTPQIQHSLSEITAASDLVDKEVPKEAAVTGSNESLSTEKKMPKWFTSIAKKK